MKPAEFEVLFERIELRQRIKIKCNINQIRDVVNSKCYYFEWLYDTLWYWRLWQIHRYKDLYFRYRYPISYKIAKKGKPIEMDLPYLKLQICNPG